MLITRIAKIVMLACLAAFCLLVVLGNVTDYQANFLFVKHVMSMDTTYPGNKLMYRAITNPELWHGGYALIIAGEALTGLLFLAGAIALLAKLSAPGAEFDRAKGWSVAAALMAFLVWFFGFLVIGGEWFLMWQSATWNGQDAAFMFYMTALGVLIFVNQPDCDLPAAGDGGGAAASTLKPAREEPAKEKAPAKKKASAARKAPAKKRAPAKKKAPAKKRAKTSAVTDKLSAVSDKLQEET